MNETIRNKIIKEILRNHVSVINSYKVLRTLQSSCEKNYCADGNRQSKRPRYAKFAGLLIK